MFGAPENFKSNNGLEFQNEDLKVVCGIKQLFTAVESPLSNGQCEKIFGLLNNSIRKMKDDGCNRYVMLTWNITDKNSLLQIVTRGTIRD